MTQDTRMRRNRYIYPPHLNAARRAALFSLVCFGIVWIAATVYVALTVENLFRY